MGKKFCVYACKTNYSSEKLKSDKILVYLFPKDEKEKEKWIKAVPNANLRVSKDIVVCALHWPSGFEDIQVNGKSRPKDPPSIWPGVPSSQTRTASKPQRPTKKACSSTRSIEEDQLSEFLSSDKVIFTSLKENLLKSLEESLVHLSCFIYRRDTLCSISAVFNWSISFSY